MSEFKDMLKYFRQRAGLSQAELASKIGLSASTISMYEVGERQPDFEKEELLADFFNVSLDVLRGKDTETAIDKEHRELLEEFDSLSEEDKASVRKYMKFLKG